VVCTSLQRIVSFDPQLAVLRVTGDEVRATSGMRRRPLSAALMATRDVSVELAELRFADPSLMLDLAVLAQRLRAQGQALLLRGPQPHIRTLIELVGLDRLPSVAVEPQALGA
jgi:anti-anti-sigma regulatory factor